MTLLVAAIAVLATGCVQMAFDPEPTHLQLQAERYLSEWWVRDFGVVPYDAMYAKVDVVDDIQHCGAAQHPLGCTDLISRVIRVRRDQGLCNLVHEMVHLQIGDADHSSPIWQAPELHSECFKRDGIL